MLFQSKFEYSFTTAMYSYVFKIKVNRKVNQGSYLVDTDSREYSIDLNLINKNSFISKWTYSSFSCSFVSIKALQKKLWANNLWWVASMITLLAIFLLEWKLFHIISCFRHWCTSAFQVRFYMLKFSSQHKQFCFINENILDFLSACVFARRQVASIKTAWHVLPQKHSRFLAVCSSPPYHLYALRSSGMYQAKANGDHYSIEYFVHIFPAHYVPFRNVNLSFRNFRKQGKDNMVGFRTPSFNRETSKEKGSHAKQHATHALDI